MVLERGWSAVVLDDVSTGRVANLVDVREHERFRFVHGSVLDGLVVDDLVRDCDIIVHLAGAVGVKLIVEQPLRSLMANRRGSEIVLATADRYRKKILLASTSEIYGKNSNVPLGEMADRVLGPPSVARWAYSTSKALDETLAYAYHKERGLPTIVARPFNAVGPRQSPAYGMVIPRLVRQALAGEPLTVYGDGTQRRCFCHVKDVVDALLRLLDHPDAEGDVFNVGSTEEVSMLELAERIRQRARSASRVQLISYDRAYDIGFEEVVRRMPDTAKIAALTGWAATRGLDEILDDIIAEARLEVARLPQQVGRSPIRPSLRRERGPESSRTVLEEQLGASGRRGRVRHRPE
jgi:UDP-glucose 4-epimerase